jgi:hypothetical protein
MERTVSFEEVVDAADRLGVEEQEALLEIVRKRVIAKRRAELVENVKAAEQEFQEGRCPAMTADEIVAGIFP